MNRFLGWLVGHQYQESSFRFARLRDHRSATSNPQPGATLVESHRLGYVASSLALSDAGLGDRRAGTTYFVHALPTTCVCGDPGCDLLWQDGGRPQAWERSHGSTAG